MGTETNLWVDRDVMVYGERNPATTGSAVAVEVDNYAPWLVGIDAAHHEIHHGTATWSYWLTASAATGASGAWYITTGSAGGGYLHFRITGIATSADKLTLKFWESASASSGYTASAVPVRRNRNASGTPNVTIYTGSGAIDASTELDRHYLGGGTGVGGAKSGGSSEADEEWVLAPSTTYALNYHNGSSGENIITLRVFAYQRA